MATLSELKSQLNQLHAAGKQESTSKSAGKVARQIKELEASGGYSSGGGGGLGSFGDTLQNAISLSNQAFQPAVQKMESGISNTQTRFQELIDSIKQSGKVAENRQTVATSAELGRRGVLPTSGLGQQQLTDSLAPVTAQFAQQAAQTGVQGVSAENALLSQVSQLLAQGAQSGISTGLTISGQQEQARQYDLNNKLQQAQQLLQQRQFQESTLPLTQYNINKPYTAGSSDGGDWS